MKFENNPKYLLVCKDKQGNSYYCNANSSEIHLSRYVAAQAQLIYSESGATKDVLTAIVNQMLDIVNEEKTNNKRLKSDIAVLCNNILYRTKYPVDEDCILRMGAIYTYMDGEDPDKCEEVFISRKIALAKEDSELYTFFIHMGHASTPRYKELLPASDVSDYLTQRAKTLETLTLRK